MSKRSKGKIWKQKFESRHFCRKINQIKHVFQPLTPSRSKFSCVWTTGSESAGPDGRVQVEPRTSRDTTLTPAVHILPASATQTSCASLKSKSSHNTIIKKNPLIHQSSVSYLPLFVLACVCPVCLLFHLISDQPWTSESQAKTNIKSIHVRIWGW